MPYPLCYDASRCYEFFNNQLIKEWLTVGKAMLKFSESCKLNAKLTSYEEGRLLGLQDFIELLLPRSVSLKRLILERLEKSKRAVASNISY